MATMHPPAPVEVFSDGRRRPAAREWVPEAPVAIEFNGIGYAVMMATPADLADFVTGFAIAEGLIEDAGHILDLAEAQVDAGWIVRCRIAGPGAVRIAERVRVRVSESSCGLCGIENLAELARALPAVAAHAAITPPSIFAALGALRERQGLGRRTGAAHAAAWVDPAGVIDCLREDVGRHNALDKLVGAMARAGARLDRGFILSTARCSYEIVEKAVRAGATTLVTISLPTSLAVDRARAAGLSLWVLARDDSVLLVNDAGRPG